MKLTEVLLKQVIKEVMGEEVTNLSSFKKEKELKTLKLVADEAQTILLDIVQPLQNTISDLKNSSIVDYRSESPGEIEALEDILDTVSEFLLGNYSKVSAEEPEMDHDERLRRRYDDEERAIKRAGPHPSMTPEEHSEYMSLYDDDEDL